MLDQLRSQLANGQILKLNVIVTPKSQQNKVLSCKLDQQSNQYTLKIKVRGVPENGQVNENLINFLAKEFDLSKSTITIISGFTGRQKIISIHALQQ